MIYNDPQDINNQLQSINRGLTIIYKQLQEDY
jgi:hypothetical protein